MAKCAHFVISRDFIDEYERKFGGSRCCLNYTQFNHMRCCNIDTECDTGSSKHLGFELVN